MTALALEGRGGLHIAGDALGPTDGPPLLLLHGGGQTRGSWSGAGDALAARGWRVLNLDARGHGESGWDSDGEYDIDAFVGDLDAVVRTLDAPPVLIGASLGGITSLLAAAELRTPARALVLVDVAHRIEAEGVREIVDFMTAAPDGFATVQEAADAVTAYLPHRPAPDDLSGLERNLRRKGDRWVWHWDPRFMDGVNRSRHGNDPDRLHRAAETAASVPILLVRGGSSAVVSPEIAEEFAALVPGSQVAEVASAGHMVAGDRNDRFLGAVLPFLDALT